MSPEEQARHDKRMYQHRHNAKLGNVGIIRAYLKGIKGPGTSIEAGLTIDYIHVLLDDLEKNLRMYRIEPDGTRTVMKHKGEEAIERLRNGQG